MLTYTVILIKMVKTAKKMVSFFLKRYDLEQNEKSGEKYGIIFYIMN